MKKYFAVSLSLAFLVMLAIAAHAEWISLDGTRVPRAPAVRVVSNTPDEIVLEVSVSGYEQEQITSPGGVEYTRISLPQYGYTQEKAAPQTPTIACALIIPDDRKPVVSVTKDEKVVRKLPKPILPSVGPVTRNIDISKLEPEQGPLYHAKDDTLFPEKGVVMSGPVIFRDFRGIRLEISAVQANAAKNEITVHKAMTIKVQTREEGGANVKTHRAPFIADEFKVAYSDFFLNYSYYADRPVSKNPGRVLVIAHDSFVEAMKPYVTWKMKDGHPVELVSVTQAGGPNAAAIKAFIQDKYLKEDFVYVILVGDEAQIPTLRGENERAPSDPCYTKTEGVDHLPDMIICRFSATTPQEVTYQVLKSIYYSQYPQALAADEKWLTAGVGIASAEGSPTDYERAEWLRAGLEKYGFKVDKIYDPGASATAVAKAVNEGRSLINYIGHGSKTSWVTSRFSNTNVAQLTNGWMLPVIWSVACVNGQFTGTGDCFAEAWMKSGTPEAPKGAVMIFAASTNAEWVPPCDCQNHINLGLLVKERELRLGPQALGGVMNVFKLWGIETKQSGTLHMEQYHIFGDATIIQRTRPAGEINVVAGQSGNIASFSAKVKGKPVAFGKVALYNEDMSFYRSVFLDASGKAEILLDEKETGPLYYTVTGLNAIPVVDRKL